MRSYVHISLAISAWLREAGHAGPIFEWRHPLTSGPFEEPFAQDEVRLLSFIHEHAQSTVIVWGTGNASHQLLSARVNGRMSEAGLGEAQMGYVPSGKQQPDAHALLLWRALTANTPHGLVSMLTNERRAAALGVLRWLPRSDSGLNYWQHWIIDALSREPMRRVALLGRALSEHPGAIGDLVVGAVLKELTDLSLVQETDEGFRSSTMNPVAPILVSNTSSLPFSGAWTVEDHVMFQLVKRR